LSGKVKKERMNSQIYDVTEGIGDFIEYWGFKKIHGKLWSLIFLAKEPVDAKYLMENLNVSKALISLSLKDLMGYDVILTSPEKRSTVHYISNPNLLDVIMNVILSREAKMLLKIRNSCELLERRRDEEQTLTLVSEERLKKLHQMVDLADKALKKFITLKQLNFKELGKSLIIKQ
jgi:DNA-binding transcriptional regulator GbsR (MarR family)